MNCAQVRNAALVTQNLDRRREAWQRDDAVQLRQAGVRPPVKPPTSPRRQRQQDDDDEN